MKVSKKRLIRTHTSDTLANLVFISMLSVMGEMGSEEAQKYLHDTDWENKEEEDVEVKLTVNGVELDLEEYCKRWDADIERQIKEKASELVSEKFNEVTEFFSEIEKQMKRKVRKELGLKLDEYNW